MVCSVNIALVNDTAMLAKRTGIDIRVVVDAAATTSRELTRFDPGPGLGGHRSISLGRTREFRTSTELIELASKLNHQHFLPLRRARRAGPQRRRKGAEGRILILGAAYNLGVGDIRDSPAVRTIAPLSAHGASVSDEDDNVPFLPGPGRGLRSARPNEGQPDARCETATGQLPAPG